jgi:Fe-Mn family superoxide dismutase
MHTLPQLTYEYDALEPHLDARTMEIHHTKHHQGYVDKFNSALEQLEDLQEVPVEELMGRLDEISDKSLRTAVKNNGGGHANHSLFWQVLSPEGGEPTGILKEALESAFGSVEEFQNEFTNAASTHFGSGWAWLVVDGGELKVMSTPNQDNPWMTGATPILSLDVWEHAYYLNYQNRRSDYIESFWNVVNWPKVSELYEAVK